MSIHTYRNDLHRTVVRTTLSPARIVELERRLSTGEATPDERRTALRIMRALCPGHDKGCKCGGPLHVDNDL